MAGERTHTRTINKEAFIMTIKNIPCRHSCVSLPSTPPTSPPRRTAGRRTRLVAPDRQEPVSAGPGVVDASGPPDGLRDAPAALPARLPPTVTLGPPDSRRDEAGPPSRQRHPRRTRSGRAPLDALVPWRTFSPRRDEGRTGRPDDDRSSREVSSRSDAATRVGSRRGIRRPALDLRALRAQRRE